MTSVRHPAASSSLRQRRAQALVLPAAALISSSPSCNAAEFWSGMTTITQVYPAESGLVFFTAYSNALSTCDGGTRWEMPIGEPNYKVQAVALLLAFSQRLSITIHVPDQSASCAPRVDRFRVEH